MPASATSTLRATFPSDTSYLALVTNLARNAARTAGFDEADADKVALATDEAVTNVIEHAYHGRKGRTIELVVRLLDEGIELHVIHDGDPIDLASLERRFDPAEIVERGQRRGFGIVLMRRLMDRVDFRPTGDRRSECCLSKFKGDGAPTPGPAPAAGKREKRRVRRR
jgi:anti-sigma regulatory factor (Ser/Thr protein kinase)